MRNMGPPEISAISWGEGAFREALDRAKRSAARSDGRQCDAGQRPCIKTPLRFDDIQFYRIDDIHDSIVMICTLSRDEADMKCSLFVLFSHHVVTKMLPRIKKTDFSAVPLGIL